MSEPGKKIVKWCDTKVDEISDKTEREHNSKLQEEKREKKHQLERAEKNKMLCEIHNWNNLLRRYLYGGRRDPNVTSLALVKNLNVHN